MIVEASVESLDPFIQLLDEVGAWLWQKGVRQWAPGVHAQSRDELERQVMNGRLILAYHHQQLAGGCIVTEIMPAVWSYSPAAAMYLGSLVVARFAAGQGVGSQILDRAAEVARQRGKSRLHLDCWDGNDFLKSYYQREGFQMLHAVQEKDYFCRLFEKQVGR
ncbi:MAG: GNAT family N-acetyltransferase [Anaerolineae bacterium]|nr:GNAT family N-acetyltransferase [Anaerolineae bacterium]